ncbi:MAG: hypothetical protein M1524_03715, partial [Patescibacteria group bacterium]|nr:hypothetical protein [Patescibacteria group bacterium]
MSIITNKSIKEKSLVLFKYWYLLVVLVFIGSIPAQRASALTMTNDNYILQMGNLNMGAGKPTGPSSKLGFTMGQLGAGLYSKDGVNYKVRSGFQYIHSIIPFTFSIDNTLVDFGTLTATNPVTRTNKLTVSNGSAAGYVVTAQENHQLLVPGSGALIPNTTCDNNLCDATTSDAWTSTLTYGFGYRCDNEVGTDCASGFASADNYKQFAASPSAATVMTGANVGRNKRVQITYKVNISGTQVAGFYTNMITFIALAFWVKI